MDPVQFAHALSNRGQACANGFSSSPQGGTSVQKLKTFAATLVCASLLPISATYAQTISKGDYKTSKTRLSADYKSDKKKLSAGTEQMRKAEKLDKYSGPTIYLCDFCPVKSFNMMKSNKERGLYK
jgi:hypothetical protein